MIPQSWLDGGATAHGVLLGLRHDGMPVAAYFLGRALDLTRARAAAGLHHDPRHRPRAVAAFGLVDIYAIPLQWWRDSGAPGWFREQLGFAYQGLSGLPENFVYNTGDEQPLRRLVSTFLSPLATSYLFVVALLVAAAWLSRDRLRGWMLALWIALVALLFAGLLWTHSRSSYLALALGLVVYALRAPAVAHRAAARVRGRRVRGDRRRGRCSFARIRTSAPTHAGLVPAANAPASSTTMLRTRARAPPRLAATRRRAGGRRALRLEHRQPLAEPPRRRQDGARPPAGLRPRQRRLDRPADGRRDQGRRVDLHRARRRAPACSAGSSSSRGRWRSCGGSGTPRSWRRSFAAVLALGLQTDVIGVPWLACVLWALAGSRVLPPRER